MKPKLALILLAGMMFLSSCSTPGGGPTPGQLAVQASAMHRTSDAEIAQQMQFMRTFNAIQRTAQPLP